MLIMFFQEDSTCHVMTHTERLKAAIIGGDLQTVRESLSRRQVSDTFKVLVLTDGIHFFCEGRKEGTLFVANNEL